MQKLVIFGGTGMTGTCAVEHAVKRGLKVRILVRDEGTIPESIKNDVEIIKGDVTKLEDVEKAVSGQDAVCVVLGTRNNVDPTTALSTGMKNIVTAMKKENLKKVSVCLSAFLFYEPAKVPVVFTHLTAEHQRMMDIVKGSGLEWRAVNPPHIADEPQSEYQVLHDKSPGRAISKHSLGQFLVDCLEQDEHNQKVIGLAKK